MKKYLPTLPKDILINIIRDIILDLSESNKKKILNRKKLKELIDKEIQKNNKGYKLVHYNTIRDSFDIVESFKELPYKYIEKNNEFHEIEIIPQKEIEESLSVDERLKRIEKNLQEIKTNLR